ncbi:SIMPL domain-containing protein [Sporosarcina sp. Marseille-Q4063]|uniref:SIMPL domain-containing protein n=1 Tax=Sporosarcina sp. Marseille-Q4063 TaxID=2810514 RepID=UPI001BAFFF78|nr:SIMPL domain-containing protein [Sporosarcina sp. Marseille-Q4063]QUW22005.1 SIMPL domain-containing protein [Sporosarcina sp. Marseille-Q4063]
MYYPYVQQMTCQQKRVMTVIGIGSFSITPDTVQIQLEVRTESKQLSQAQQENADLMSQVIESLLELGIAREDIQTVSYNISPQYDYVEGQQIFRGYEVINSINVTIKNIEQAGTIIDTAVRNGVNQVSNIRFTVENEQIPYQEALSLALKNALAKAQTIANTIQLKLDPHPIKIVETMKEEPILFRSFAANEMRATTPIEPGQIDIKATVEVQFQY